jgi:hypothetical protein
MKRHFTGISLYWTFEEKIFRGSNETGLRDIVKTLHDTVGAELKGFEPLHTRIKNERLHPLAIVQKHWKK